MTDEPQEFHQYPVPSREDAVHALAELLRAAAKLCTGIASMAFNLSSDEILSFVAKVESATHDLHDAAGLLAKNPPPAVTVSDEERAVLLGGFGSPVPPVKTNRFLARLRGARKPTPGSNS